MVDRKRFMAAFTSEQDRLGLLEQLVEALTVKERRALSVFLCRKTDPLHILPVEVVIHVFSYLDSLDAWRYQSVSRQWRVVLSSDKLLKAALATWYTHHPTDCARNCESTSTIAKATHIQAMRQGLPFTSMSMLAHHQKLMGMTARQSRRWFALKAYRIAYVQEVRDGMSNVVVLLDLISGEERCFVGAAREAITSIALTSSMLVFINYHGRLYVQSLVDPSSEMKRVQLPSSSHTAFVAEGDHIAIVFRHTLSSDERSYTLALYDNTSGKLKEISLPYPISDDQTIPSVALLNTKEKIIDLFCSELVDLPKYAKDLVIYHRRYSFEGQELQSSKYLRERVVYRQPDGIAGVDLHSTGVPGLFIFRTGTMWRWKEGGAHDDPFEFALCFDQQKGRIEERYFTGEYIASRHQGSTAESEALSDFTLWKDTRIESIARWLERPVSVECTSSWLQFSNEIDDDSSLPTDQELPSTPPTYQLTNHILLSSKDENPAQNGCPEYTVFANDTFVVAVAQETRGDDPGRFIHVFCFDPELQCAGFVDTELWPQGMRRDLLLRKSNSASETEG